MKKWITALLTIALLLSCSVTAFAAEATEGDPAEIGVFAKSEYDIEGVHPAPVEDRKAEIELPDGTEVEIEDLPDDAETVVITPIPDDEEEAIDWFEDVIEDEGTEPKPHIITIIDEDGNEENADDVTVTMDIPEGIENPVVIGVDTDGNTHEIPSTVKDGKITFEADGSDYYVIAEKTTDTNIPGTDSPQTGDNTHLWLWWLLLIISVALLVVTASASRKNRKVNH